MLPLVPPPQVPRPPRRPRGLHRLDERRRPLLRPRIDVHAMIEQPRDDFRIPALGRDVNGGFIPQMRAMNDLRIGGEGFFQVGDR